MIEYKHNPKTAGSGIICAIPQRGTCPMRCKDCFFQSGRSYLEPLSENLPNVPSQAEASGRIVRMNDGNDSNHKRELVIQAANQYRDAFFNTACPQDLEGYGGPVVLTINPAGMTNDSWHRVKPIPDNLMFVRIRANTWNEDMACDVVSYYTEDADRQVPVVFTFMAYYSEDIPEEHRDKYTFRKRTLNSYFVINPEEWERIMRRHSDNPFVYACGKDANTFPCMRCGNCLREYFATKERLS